MKKYTCKIGPIEATFPRKRDAREEIDRKAGEALFRMDDGAILFSAPRLGDVVAIAVVPALYGWSYMWIDNVSPRGRTIVGCLESQLAALWQAVQHVAQLCIDEHTDRVQLNHLQEWAAKVLRDESQSTVLRADLSERVAWHKRYAKARTNGASDNEAHTIASHG